ncbi:hypothetical protein TIFTF001_029909 [Ficus carica]|uniref:Uncharacterized protein n=1 Tax=Ficus carica TaxID=3494 RepID=A0AA88DWM5_FICCA|nr:hypothetical protein TIFTF001_029909 [Ficus carica]
MSDMSDSENAQMSWDADVTGSLSSIMSSSSNTTRMTGEAAAPRDWTPNNLSGISDIPSPSRPATPTSRVLEGAAQLKEILRMGPVTRPDQGFIQELNGTAEAQPAPVVDLTAGGDVASEMTASQASMSGRDGSQSSESTAPAGEPI